MMPGSFGRKECSGIPEENEFYRVMAEEARKHAIPLSGTFELTPRCNFNCKMCYVHLAADRIPLFGKELTADEWIRVAEEARDAGMLQLCITGGEPILHPEFETIYREISKMGFFITLQTNASVLSDNILSLLEEYPPQDAKITIYGSDNEIYRAVCGVENGFTRTDQGIRDLLQLGIPVMSVTTVIKQNKDDLENIYQYTQKLKIPWIYTSGVKPSVRGAETNAREVAIDEESATDYREDVRQMIQRPAMKDEKKPCEYCRGYRMSFWVSWDGNMRFCSFMNEPDISVREYTFSEAWKQLVEYEERLQWPVPCRTCEIRHICRRCIGMLAAFSGSVDRVDEGYCKRIRGYCEIEKRRD